MEKYETYVASYTIHVAFHLLLLRPRYECCMLVYVPSDCMWSKYNCCVTLNFKFDLLRIDNEMNPRYY